MSDSEKPKRWRERRQSIKHKWQVPLIFCIEWPCEWISYWLEQWAFLDILKRLGHLAIVVAVISYIWGYSERQRQAEAQLKAKHYQAWQVIIAAQGQRNGGGRRDSLRDLNNDDVSLAGLDISGALLPELNLVGAHLVGANLANVVITDANLAGANLSQANLTGAELRGINLIGADLSDANAAGANLSYFLPTGKNVDTRNTNLSGAKLIRANFSNADLNYANLSGAILWDANFAEANLEGANLSNALFSAFPVAALGGMGTYLNLAKADLTSANLSNIKGWEYVKNMKLANINLVENPPEGFIEWAEEHGAVSVNSLGIWRNYIREKELEETKEKQ